jgi:hypothetical protein
VRLSMPSMLHLTTATLCSFGQSGRMAADSPQKATRGAPNDLKVWKAFSGWSLFEIISTGHGWCRATASSPWETNIRRNGKYRWLWQANCGFLEGLSVKNRIQQVDVSTFLFLSPIYIVTI